MNIISNIQKEHANKSGIYKIWNTLDDRVYIGSAVIFRKRRDKHFRELKTNKHHSSYLQRFANKYGLDKLVFEVIEVVENKYNLLEREQYYIDTLKPEFNCCLVVSSPLGVKRSDEFKRKLSESKKQYWKDNPDKLEHIRSIGRNRKGVKLSEETIIKRQKTVKLKQTILKQKIVSKVIQYYKDGLTISEIIKASNLSRCSVYKYLQDSNIIQKKKINIPILQYDLLGNLVNEYGSISKAKLAGFNKREVKQCCNSKREHYKNYKFQFKNIEHGM